MRTVHRERVAQLGTAPPVADGTLAQLRWTGTDSYTATKPSPRLCRSCDGSRASRYRWDATCPHPHNNWACFLCFFLLVLYNAPCFLLLHRYVIMLSTSNIGRRRRVRTCAFRSRPLSPTLSQMINWPPSDTIVIVDDSDDDVEQHAPQRSDEVAGMGVAAETIRHTPLAAAAAAAAADSLPLSPGANQPADANHMNEGEPAASTAVQAGECTVQPPAMEHLARHPHDVTQCCESAEGGNHMMTSCRPCRQHDESTTKSGGHPRLMYQCPCGSVLRTTSIKGHERTKKHKACSRGARVGVRRAAV